MTEYLTTFTSIWWQLIVALILLANLSRLIGIIMLFIEWPKIQKIKKIKASPNWILLHPSIFWPYYRLYYGLNKSVKNIADLHWAHNECRDTGDYLYLHLNWTVYFGELAITALMAAAISLIGASIIALIIHFPITMLCIFSTIIVFWLFVKVINYRFNTIKPKG